MQIIPTVFSRLHQLIGDTTSVSTAAPATAMNVPAHTSVSATNGIVALENTRNGAANFYSVGVLHPTIASHALMSSQSTTTTSASFADQVRSGTPGFDLILAQMSKGAYAPSNVAIPGWSVATPNNMPPGFADSLPPGVEMLPDGRIVCQETGLQAVIYTDGAGHYVLAFAGTDPNSFSDWSTNVSNGTSGMINLNPNDPLGRAYAQGIQITGLLADSVGKENVVVTGHSLGGGMAAAASWVQGVPAVTFNAAGPSIATLIHNQADVSGGELFGFSGDHSASIRNYVLDGEPLTWFQENSGLAPRAVGENIRLDNATADSWLLGLKSPLALHGINGVIAAMQTSAPSILNVEQTDTGGTRITVFVPTSEHAGEQLVIEFDASAEGQAAANAFIHDFPMTGQTQTSGGTVVSRSEVHLGPWATGSSALADTMANNSAIITEHADGSRTVAVSIDGGNATLQQQLHYRPDGTLERIDTTVQYGDGATLTIQQRFDDNGKELIDQRRYQLAYQDEAGNPVVMQFDETGMQELMALTQTARENNGNGLPMLDPLFADDGTALLGEGTIGFAISLVRTEGIDGVNGLDDYLFTITQHGDGDGDARTFAPLPEQAEPIAP